MKLNLAQSINTLDGKPFEPATTLSEGIFQVLMSPVDTDTKLDAAKRFEIFKLAERVFKAEEATLTVEEIALIKGRAVKVCPSNYFYGQLVKLLEGETAPA